ncbi:ATP-grasp domain-containing protein [Dactylosporangium sp. CA-139066]|uniref:ATP-grasp domain-containing protein n=1 Tax=Dactylosporangium sp. CA-139066 TaxID=3239930 RepID=UPI003D933965
MRARATHALVGFSKGLVADLDRLLPPASVVVLEEADVIVARDVRRRLSPFRCVASLLEMPIHDEVDTTRLLRAAGGPGDIGIVLPAVEYGVVAAAALAEAWQLRGAGTEAARILRDKEALRRHAGTAGLPQPRWRVATGPADVTAFRASHGRCVLKPTGRQASLGVRVVSEHDDVAAAWSQSAGVDESRMRARFTTPVRYLVEEYLEGPEVSVECLVDDGAVRFVNVTAKVVHTGPWPVELGHVVPAALPADVTATVVELTTRLATTVGFGSGVLHAEWILVGGVDPHLVECAARLPGDSIDELIDLAYGGSITADLVGLLGGAGVADRSSPSRGAAIRFLTCPPGVVADVSGIDVAERSEGVHQVAVTAKPGSTVAPLTSSWERVGHVIATGPTGPDAEDRAARAAALIAVSTR